MNFPCTKCGRCCRLISAVPALADYDNGEGVCRHLVGNLCAIYETRPAICNVSVMYTLYFKSTMTEEQFITLNLESCKKIAMLFNEKVRTDL